MKSKMLYVRVVGILLTASLLCSACSTQKAGKQSLSVTGTAVLTPPGVETETPAGIEEEDIEDQKAEKTTQKDKNGTVWDMSKEVTVKQDGFTYHAYLSKDGKESWIYQADPGSDRKTTLAFPEEVQGAVLTKLGAVPEEDEDAADCVYDIFGNSEEPWHLNDDNWDYIFNRNTNGIRKIICPSTVKSMEAATFCCFSGLEEVILPEQLKEIPSYLLFLCVNLKKIVLPQNPDLTMAYGCWLVRCNRLKEVELPKGSDYCVKDGMLLSKDKKTLYQVFVTGKTVNVPEGITRMATGAVNAIDITKINSVRLPSTLKKMDLDAIQDERTEGELGGRIKSVTVASNNPVFAQAENCIYERATGTLAVFVGTKKSMTLPEEIRYISDVHSQVGKEIERLVIPAGFKAFKTNQCLVKGIEVEKFVEFLSVNPPKAEVKGKKIEGIGASCYLIDPKEGVKAYKKWYEKVEGKGNKLTTVTKGNRSCILEKSEIDTPEMITSEYVQILKKYGF